MVKARSAVLFIVIGAIASKATAPKEKTGRTRSGGETIWANESDLAALPIATAQRIAIKAANFALENGQGKLFEG